MNTVARILIWNKRVGAVAWNDNRGIATFEYAPDFLKTDLDIAPLHMPLEQARSGNRVFSFPTLNRETYKGLPGLLADCLPDRFGNQLIDAWLARQGRLPGDMNPVERLCYIGRRGMGALEFEPVTGPESTASAQLDVQELVVLAQQILHARGKLETNLHQQPEKGLQDIIRVGTSAGGARAKAIIAYNPVTGDVRSGQIDRLKGYEYWLMKFDGVTNQHLGDPEGYGRIEYAYYLMAKDAGIDMMESRLLKENGRAHFMTKRFDRDGKQKLHVQTLCAIAHFDYNQPGLYAYEQVFQVMRLLRLPYRDMEQAFRRLAFNVMAKNQDDHTKNISFLMNDHGRWQLAPAYDMTYAFNPVSKWTSMHQLTLGGKRSEIRRNDLLEFAHSISIKKANALIDQIKAVVGDWTSYAQQAGVGSEQRRAIGRTFFK